MSPQARAVTGERPYAQLCGECGQLSWPAASVDSPHRREPSVALVRQPPCSHCGERSWISLAPGFATMVLRERSERQRARGDGRRRVFGAAAVGMFAGLSWAVIGSGSWFAVTVGVAYMVMTAAFAYRNTRARRSASSSLPERWSMALAPAGRPSATTRGAARVTASRLIAPLSGRPCAAYEVAVRHDADASAAPSTWALIEQRVAPLEVDGRPVDPARTHLELTRARCEPARRDAVEEYLRSRGLAEHGTPWVLYEATIEDGDPVELVTVGEGAILRRSG